MITLPKVDCSDRSEWVRTCQERGLEGPYTITGNPPREQFIRRPSGETAAMWNITHQVGVVFEENRADEGGGP